MITYGKIINQTTGQHKSPSPLCLRPRSCQDIFSSGYF